MLLVEKSVALKLSEGNSFNVKALASEMIDYQTFKGYKDEFDRTMDQYGHGDDKVKQHFLKKAFKGLKENDKIEKYAFVFLSKPKGQNQRLSVAMLGLDKKEKFVYKTENLFFKMAFQSDRSLNKGEPPIKVKKKDFEELNDFYKNRRVQEDRMNHLPTHDMGIWHDRNDFNDWLESVDDYAEVHFGVQQPNNFQVVMLVSDRSLKSSPPQPGTAYAFDRGNGCCPEQ